MAKARTNQLTR
jgi:hypothetical protein